MDWVVCASYAGRFGSVSEPVERMLAMFEALACKRKEADFRPDIAIPMEFSMISYYHGVVNMLFIPVFIFSRAWSHELYVQSCDLIL